LIGEKIGLDGKIHQQRTIRMVMLPRRLALLHSAVIPRHFPSSFGAPLAAQTLSTSSIREGKTGYRKGDGSRGRADAKQAKAAGQSLEGQQIRTAVKKVAEEIEPGSNAGQSRFPASQSPSILQC
jgi:hypothetical protein